MIRNQANVAILLVIVLPCFTIAAEPRSPQKVAAEIDRLVDQKLHAAKIPPSPRAEDAQFLRRVCLDLTGKLPTPERAVAFLDSKDPDKRAKLIEELLAKPEYGKKFGDYWAELVAKRNDFNKLYSGFYAKWLAEQFNQGKGWDETVRAMILARGTGPETYFLMSNVERDISPSRTTGGIGALFLGQQLACAECHRHPVNRNWKREDYWGMAAFFSRTKLVKDAKNARAVTDVDESPKEKGPKINPKTPKDKRPELKRLPPGTLEIPDANDNAIAVGLAYAKFLEGKKADLGETGSYREPLAAWLTSPDNKMFARAAVNRLWAYFFSRGFVNPLDDMGPHNEPSHPEVLTLLAEEFVASAYDYRHIIRCICATSAYQRSSRSVKGNESDQNLFSHMPARVVKGVQLIDMYEQVLGKYKGPQEKSGRGGRDGVPVQSTPDLLNKEAYDERPDTYTFGIPQALRLMNRYLPERQQALVKQLAESKKTPEENIEHLYLLTFSRRPTAGELAEVRSFLREEGDVAQGYAGVIWVMLNSPEFVTVP